MRKIIVWMGMSVDGFMAGPDGEIDWHRVDDELHADFNRMLRGMGAFLQGRVTYEGMEEFWSTADQRPESTAPMLEFAGIWRDVPTIVYSRTLERVGEGATLVRDVVPDEVRALKAQPGGDMTLGGANLAATFERLGLVDEYRLFVQPVAIGRGRPVFAPDTRIELELAETRVYGNGVDHAPLRPVGRHRGPSADRSPSARRSGGAMTAGTHVEVSVRSERLHRPATASWNSCSQRSVSSRLSEAVSCASRHTRSR